MGDGGNRPNAALGNRHVVAADDFYLARNCETVSLERGLECHGRQVRGAKIAVGGGDLSQMIIDGLQDGSEIILITNDGELTEKLTHPSYNKKKIYQVSLDSNLKQSDFDKILKGIYLDDGMISADALSYVEGDQTQVGIEIHSGRNRIVRRIFESLGYKVVKLDRVYFAGLTKKNLRRGQWRFLTDKELSILKMGSYE